MDVRRQPNLPVDFLLGRNTTSSCDINLDRWVELHSEKLAFAYNKANEELRTNENDRKQRHERDKCEKELQIGDKVYMRNRGLIGRTKIQDKWKPEVHVIVGKPYNSVYSVKSENSDTVKNVNRMEIKPVIL